MVQAQALIGSKKKNKKKKKSWCQKLCGKVLRNRKITPKVFHVKFKGKTKTMSLESTK